MYFFSDEGFSSSMELNIWWRSSSYGSCLLMEVVLLGSKYSDRGCFMMNIFFKCRSPSGVSTLLMVQRLSSKRSHIMVDVIIRWRLSSDGVFISTGCIKNVTHIFLYIAIRINATVLCFIYIGRERRSSRSFWNTSER